MAFTGAAAVQRTTVGPNRALDWGLRALFLCSLICGCGAANSQQKVSGSNPTTSRSDSGSPVAGDEPPKTPSDKLVDGSAAGATWGPEVHYRMAPLLSFVSPGGGWGAMTLPIGTSVECGYRVSPGLGSGGLFFAIYGPGVNYARVPRIASD